MNEKKYHVALSFAGEDRNYVKKVAAELVLRGVKVFYDEFEEADLWGKDLYVYLSDVYEKKAHFTVMFVSAAYRDKVWPNHERKSAQARALEEQREYILPAFFDDSIQLLGLLKTIKRVSLSTKSPEEFAEFIIQKLLKSGIALADTFSYSNEARADVDFPLLKTTEAIKTIKCLKKYDYYVQGPAVEAAFRLDWSITTEDEAFIIGRNIYQSAVGDVRAAQNVLTNLRERLTEIPGEDAAHVLNGMFFEVYFSKTGEFRGRSLKGRFLDKLLAVQKVKKCEKSILFIRRELEPYKDRLAFRPSTEPERMRVDLVGRKADRSLLKSVKLNGQELMTEAHVSHSELWELSHKPFAASKLRRNLAAVWFADPPLIEINLPVGTGAATKFHLPEGIQIGYPGGAEE